MTEAPLADLQHHIRRLLAELDRVAGLAGVPYLLAYGTALGAVRDGDLIPWDPDADVWVRTEHHPALLAACAEHLGPEFELLTAETDPGYEYLFPRLAIRGTHHVLLSLDVFPLDHAPRRLVTRRLHMLVCRLLAQIFLVKKADTSVRAHYTRRKRLTVHLLRFVAAPFPARLVLRIFRRLQRLRPSGVLVNSCGTWGDQGFLDEAWFEGTTHTPLGPVPAGYDPLLTSLYGDWRTPPPAAELAAELAHVVATWAVPLRRPGALLDPDRRPGPP